PISPACDGPLHLRQEVCEVRRVPGLAHTKCLGQLTIHLRPQLLHSSLTGTQKSPRKSIEFLQRIQVRQHIFNISIQSINVLIHPQLQGVLFSHESMASLWSILIPTGIESQGLFPIPRASMPGNYLNPCHPEQVRSDPAKRGSEGASKDPENA